MKTEQKKALFDACHAITRKTVAGTRYNYSATFSACLKLYHSNRAEFIAVAVENGAVEFVPQLDDSKFNFFTACRENDSRKIDFCLSFAVRYGLKKRDAYITRKDLENMENDDYTASDNACPKIVDSLKSNDFEDLKSSVAIYLLSRADNTKFMALPSLWQLCRAGDSVVTAEYNKAVRRSRAFGDVASLEDLLEDGVEAVDRNTERAKVDIVSAIVAQVPKKHRELAEKIINYRYANGKALTCEETAEKIGVSVRTVKTVIAEIKAIDLNSLY